MAQTRPSKKIRLTTDDYRILVTWIEEPRNRSKIYGTDKKTRVGDSSRTTKSGGYKLMANHLNTHTTNPSLPALDGRQMQQRWEWYMKKYRATQRVSTTETGMGLSADELARGITIDEKLESLCPCFARMNGVFGERANIKPSALLTLGVPSPDDDGFPTDGDETQLSENEEVEVEDTQPWQSALCESRPIGADEVYSAAVVTARLAAEDAEFDSDQDDREVINLSDSPPASPTAVPTRRGADSIPVFGASAALVNFVPSPRISQNDLSRATCGAPRLQEVSPTAQGTSKSTSKAHTASKKTGAAQKTIKATKQKRQSEGNTKPDDSKKPRPAPPPRTTLTDTYLKTSNERTGVLKEQLEDKRRQWEAQRAWELEERKSELAERRALRVAEREDNKMKYKQEVLLELVRQQKSASEIAEYLQYLS